MMIKAGSGSIQTKRRKRRRKEKLWLWEESPLFWASHAFIIFLQTLSHFLSLSLSLSLSSTTQNYFTHWVSLSLTHTRTHARTYTHKRSLEDSLGLQNLGRCLLKRPTSFNRQNKPVLRWENGSNCTLTSFSPQTFTSSSYQRRETLTLLRALFRKMAQTGAQQLTGGKVESSGLSLSKLE